MECVNPVDAWIEAIPDDLKDPCPCGCGRKWKRITKGGEAAIEEHFQNFINNQQEK